ncbi:MAG: beta-ketoacyl synthase [Gammaproteobacteria bacterium]
MQRLPVIVGFGGVNAAGRSSFHHGYQRLVLDALPAAERRNTLLGLATLTGRLRLDAGRWLDMAGAPTDPARIESLLGDDLRAATGVRRIGMAHFDTEAIPYNRRVALNAGSGPIRVVLRRRDLPDMLPPNWSIIATRTDDEVEIAIADGVEVLLPATRRAGVRAAGQLPDGFDPGAHYPSHHHPRALQMAVFAASDALASTGLDWDALRDRLPPDQLAVYASSGMGQLDDAGFGGMMKAGSNGRRTSSKQCPLGFGEMPADFINAYVLGSVGATGGMLGACATFLYNLRLGIEDIRSGRRRVVFVGTAEAPIIPEVIEGYRAMGALGEDHDLLALDPGRSEPDWRRACRPFSTNIGFTIAESAQYLVLMDDELALELGAQIHGAAVDVFVHADGWKKSISAPGAGNYLTLAKAVATARALLGDEAIRRRSYVHAHGTGTPQNRVTESHVLNETAKAFGITNWPVAAVKSFLGHSLGSAGGDQIGAALGTWAHGIIPGITSIDHIADDVHRSHLHISPEHQQVGVDAMDAAFLNSKGFGGNNATGVLLSPAMTQRLLAQRHGGAAMARWQQQQEAVADAARRYDEQATAGRFAVRYRFGQGVIDGKDVIVTADTVRLPGFGQPVTLGDTPSG